MGDVMLFGVLGFDTEHLESSKLARLQYYPRVREAAARLQAAEKRVAELEGQLEAARRATGPRIASKPDWQEAPEWAKWLAMDDDGQWFWYELRPLPMLHDGGTWGTYGKIQYAGSTTGWAETLEARP